MLKGGAHFVPVFLPLSAEGWFCPAWGVGKVEALVKCSVTFAFPPTSPSHRAIDIIGLQTRSML